jgi:hypothetical protein
MPDILNLDCFLPTPNNQDYGIWNIPPEKIISTEWLAYMKLKGVDIESCMIFYRGPKLVRNTAHIDISWDDPIYVTQFAFNIVLGDDDSDMVWYNQEDNPINIVHSRNGIIQQENNPIKLKHTQAGTAYADWPISELKEVDRCKIGNSMTLVKVDVPHTIEMGDSPRWCLSIRTVEDFNYNSWEENIEFFRSKGLLGDSSE